jgi:hypothetical protein
MNLSSLVTSIHTAIKTISTGAACLTVIIGGIWAYYTFSVDHSPQHEPYSVSQLQGK